MDRKKYLDEKEKTLLPWERCCTLDGLGDGIYTMQTIYSVIAGGLYRQMLDKMKECKIPLTYHHIDAVTDEFSWRDWRSMSVCEYLDECNDRAYDAYVDRCVDEQRDREAFG